MHYLNLYFLCGSNDYVIWKGALEILIALHQFIHLYMHQCAFATNFWGMVELLKFNGYGDETLKNELIFQLA